MSHSKTLRHASKVAEEWAKRLHEPKTWFVACAIAVFGWKRFREAAFEILKQARDRDCPPGRLFVAWMKRARVGNGTLYTVACETSGDRRRDNERKKAAKRRRLTPSCERSRADNKRRTSGGGEKRQKSETTATCARCRRTPAAR